MMQDLHNSVDPDQMPENAASNQGVHSLHVYLLNTGFFVKHDKIKTSSKTKFIKQPRKLKYKHQGSGWKIYNFDQK